MLPRPTETQTTMTRQELQETTYVARNGEAHYETPTGRLYAARLAPFFYDRSHEDGRELDMPKKWYIHVRRLIRRDGKRLY